MLDHAQAELGWPSPETLFEPQGEGAAVVADLARRKIQQRLRLLDGCQDAEVGILTPDPNSNATQAPIALVCRFSTPASLETLHKLHRLAWNFSRTSLLITAEPHRLRAFSCCERPERDIRNATSLKAELSEAEYRADVSIADTAAAALHWLNLSNGMLQRHYPKRFDRNHAADNTLLANLEAVREELGRDLDYDLVHDLLARMIFIQFLFHRCDTNGTAALNENYLRRLHKERILSRAYSTLGEILGNRRDTYALFRYLNDRFNGDLFPGKSDSKAGREREWRKEMGAVNSAHLHLLRDFVQGDMEMQSGQFSLWPLYSFDTIPLEFISSVYEAFVTKRKGTIYTPVHLVDFVLDGVLPWEGDEWDLKILDPACGSGIFLVRAFQRLVHRWKKANPDTPIRADVLRRLLTHNLVGIDIDAHAGRVASFSLYLAMSDEIEPRYYWQQVRFPRLRGSRIIEADFFSEEAEGIRTENDAESYDLVVGNPPWGKNTIKTIFEEFNSEAAKSWSDSYQWPISYGDPGPMFVAKALRLVKPDGVVSMLQPTGTLLVNQSGPAVKQRRKLFAEHKVAEIVNLSSLRFGLFKKALGPASIITVRPKPAEVNYTMIYIVVKPASKADDEYRFVIDPYDIHEVRCTEAMHDSLVWTALTWGTPRDLALLRHMHRFPTIASYVERGKLRTRWGIVRGNRKKVQPSIVDKRFFSGSDFPEDGLLWIDAEGINRNADAYTDAGASTDLTPFEPPQLLIKRSWRRETGRFRAVRVKPEDERVLCSNSYVTVSATDGDRDILDSVCLALNSNIATYYLLLASAQFSNYRDTTNVNELLSVPCPSVEPVSIQKIESYDEVDELVQNALSLKESERSLVEDLFEVALPWFKYGDDSVARRATKRAQENRESELATYAQWFLRVLHATFGTDKNICATLFEESGDQLLPVRLVAIRLNSLGRPPISTEALGSGDLADKLVILYRQLYENGNHGPSCYRRVARIFDTLEENGKRSPVIFIAKPDERRYWTRSTAMRDADEVASEILALQATRNS